MADTQIFRGAKVGVPSTYTVPGNVELRLKAVNADFDGSGSGGTYTPCVTLLSDAGEVIARAVDNTITVAGGADAEVSWFPLRRRRGAAAQTTRCTLLGSANGDTTLTLTLTKPVPGSGTLHVVWCSVDIGHNDDAGEPTNVVDSQAVAGWAWNDFTKPLIGFVSEDLTGSGPAAITQAGSVARPCTAADLGIGDTITVTFTTTRPTEFHSTGLIIYQRAYYVTVTQFGGIVFGNSDAHPDTGASLTRLSWDDDYGPGTVHADRDAVMITAMGAYPPVAGFSPFVGSVIGEIASGSCSVAAACLEMCEGAEPDPGGTWPAGAIQLVGNYQLVQPRICSN